MHTHLFLSSVYNWKTKALLYEQTMKDKKQNMWMCSIQFKWSFWKTKWHVVKHHHHNNLPLNLYSWNMYVCVLLYMCTSVIISILIILEMFQLIQMRYKAFILSLFLRHNHYSAQIRSQTSSASSRLLPCCLYRDPCSSKACECNDCH